MPSTDDIQGSLRPFLAKADVVPAGALDGAPEVFPGLFLTTAVWAEDRMEFLPAPSAGPLGGAEAARAQALKNVRELPPAEAEVVYATSGRTDSQVWVIRYEDPFGAGRVGDLGIPLSDLVAAGLDSRLLQISEGLLIGVPTWHLILVHLLHGPGALSAMKLMASAVSGEYEESPQQRRVSDRVFFIPAEKSFDPSGQLPRQVVAYPTRTGQMVVETRGAIGEVLYGEGGLLGADGRA